MTDLARIKRNVAKMVDKGAPENEIDAYIAAEGSTVDEVRAFSPNAQPAAPTAQGDLGDVISAGFTSGVNAIPFVGPQIMGGLNQLKSAVQSNLPGNAPVSPEEIAAENAQLEKQNPTAATVGSIAGPTLALAPLGMTGVGARLLGMSGSLGSRMALGGLSGAAISGGDSLVRGNSPGEAGIDALTGAGVGTALPLAGRLLKGGFDAVTGRTIPKATQNIGRALKDDGIAPADINARLGVLGPDAMLMDLGPNLQRQAGAVASVPGAGQKAVREAVEVRKARAPQRVQNDVASALGTGPEAGAIREQVVTAQKAAAKPLYDAVRDIRVDMLRGGIADVFQTPMGKQALAEARQMAANDGYRGVDTIQIIDYAKQALDDIAAEAARKGKNNLARQAGNMARQLAAEGDAVAPGYKAAREAFAGPAKVLDALDAGESTFTKEMTPRQLDTALNTMSTSERDAFVQGARSWIESQMGNAVNEALALRNLFKKGYNEAKLRMIVGDDVANKLISAMEREAKFGQSANVVAGNSETAARQAAQAEVAPELGRTWRPDGVVGLLFAAFDKAKQGLAGTRQPRINSRMAGLHTQNRLDPRQVKQLQRAVTPLPKALLPPAGAAILGQQDRRGPIEITVRGGR